MIKKLPQISVGTWLFTDPSKLNEVIKEAVKCGYKSIDTAQIYNNEATIGNILTANKINREDLFITTKVWIKNYKYYCYKSVQESLKRLQIEQLDLVLLHWPVNREINAIGYKELMRAREDGLVRNIGVSNFNKEELENLYKDVKEHPYTDQIVASPIKRMIETEKYCLDNNIKLTAYSSLRPYYLPRDNWDERSAALNEKQKSIIDTIAKNHNSTPAAIIFAYMLHKNYHVLSKTTSAERISSNYNTISTKLENNEIAAMDKMLYDKGEVVRMIKGGDTMGRFFDMTETKCKTGLLFDCYFNPEDVGK